MVYPFQYFKVQIVLKQQPDIDIPAELLSVVRAVLERCFERERMKEEWAEARKLQELKESCHD